MKSVRLQIAVLAVIGPFVLAMHALTREVDSTTTGPVWGRVTYHGRPVAEGAILFIPIAAEPIDWGMGPLGKDGRYAIDFHWRRETSETVRFRMSIVPFRNTAPSEDPSPSPGEEPRPDADPASLPAKTLDARRPKWVKPPVPERFTNIWTSPLEATLDRGSARVDVDLKD